jgi:hypothetical protein
MGKPDYTSLAILQLTDHNVIFERNQSMNTVLAMLLADLPAIDHQLPVPRVVEATGNVIDLDQPFTLELPAIISDTYTDVLLVFMNADGSYHPQAVVEGQAISNIPTRGIVDNRQLSPPFTVEHTAVIHAFIRVRQTDIWIRTPDSAFYTF